MWACVDKVMVKGIEDQLLVPDFYTVGGECGRPVAMLLAQGMVERPSFPFHYPIVGFYVWGSTSPPVRYDFEEEEKEREEDLPCFVVRRSVSV